MNSFVSLGPANGAGAAPVRGAAERHLLPAEAGGRIGRVGNGRFRAAGGGRRAGQLVVRKKVGCGKLYRARSRLYRNEILQVNMRLKALAEIYTKHLNRIPR